MRHAKAGCASRKASCVLPHCRVGGGLCLGTLSQWTSERDGRGRLVRLAVSWGGGPCWRCPWLVTRKPAWLRAAAASGPVPKGVGGLGVPDLRNPSCLWAETTAPPVSLQSSFSRSACPPCTSPSLLSQSDRAQYMETHEKSFITQH